MFIKQEHFRLNIKRTEQISNLLNIEYIPSEDLLNKISYTQLDNKKIYTFKTPDAYQIIITVKGRSIIKEIIHDEFFGPKKIYYEKSIFSIQKEEYYLNDFFFFTRSKKNIKLTSNHIINIATRHNLDVYEFIKPFPENNIISLLNQYSNKKELKQHQTDNLTNAFFHFGKNCFSQKIKELTYNDIILKNTTFSFSDFFFPEPDKEEPKNETYFPNFMIKYNKKLNIENCDDHIVLKQICFQNFENKKINIISIKLKINDSVILNYNLEKDSFSYSNILIKYKNIYDHYEQFVKIIFCKNVFPFQIEKILLPMLYTDYGLERIFYFNNNKFNYKKVLFSEKNIKEIKPLYKKGIKYNLSCMLLSYMCSKNEIKNVQLIKNNIYDFNNPTKNEIDLILMNLNDNEIMNNLDKIQTVHQEFSNIVIEHSDIKNTLNHLKKFSKKFN